MGGNEVFENGHALAERASDRHVERLALRVTHKTAHTRKLTYLLHVTARARGRHHVDGVVRVERLYERVDNFVVRFVPNIDDGIVPLVLGDETAIVKFFDLDDFRFGVVEYLEFFLRDMHVENGRRDRPDSRILITHVLYRVEYDDGNGRAFTLERSVDDALDDALVDAHIDFRLEQLFVAVAGHVPEVLRYRLVEYQPTDRRRDGIAILAVDGHRVRGDSHAAVLDELGGQFLAHFDLALQCNAFVEVRRFRFVGVGKHHALADRTGMIHREVVAAHDHIERRRAHGRAVGQLEYVVGREHEHTRFHLRFHGQRYVYSHLVAVEVGVERAARERVELDSPAVDEHRLERLNTQSVQGRRTVQQHGVVFYDFFEHVPHVCIGTLGYALRGLCIVRFALRDEFFYYERLEQLESHFFRHAALIELEFGTYDDNRTTGVVHALTQEVLTESTLFAAEQAREALEIAAGRALYRLAAPTVVYERVDGFLKHALLVANDYIGRAKFHQSAQPIVSVNDPAV